ncbi:MAG: hypothetical protein GY833_23960 [Aestuariibacter sp.]|nr:hypothetical protein [Aestuariibacter sp.]
MANEITITGKVTLKSGGFELELNSRSLKVDQTGEGGIQQVQEIGTTYEAIDLGQVATEGYAMFRNLDDTNFVQIGLDGGASLTPVMKLLATETAGPLRIDAAATLFALADTASCNLEVIILEN